MRDYVYCERCGRVVHNTINKIGNSCDTCRTGKYQEIPEGYNLTHDTKLNNEDLWNAEKQRLKEEQVKTNPDFDKDTYNRRDEIAAHNQREYDRVQAEGKALLDEKVAKELYKPKCPTCGSPDVQKISIGKKVTGGALFGIFSSNVRKSYECRNCKYKW